MGPFHLGSPRSQLTAISFLIQGVKSRFVCRQRAKDETSEYNSVLQLCNTALTTHASLPPC